jgi:hypothetical protein
MKKSAQLVFLVFVVLMAVLSGCVSAPTPVASTPTGVPTTSTPTATFTPEPTITPTITSTPKPTLIPTHEGPPKVYKEFMGIDGKMYSLEIISPYPIMPLKNGLSVEAADENDITKKYFEYAPILAFKSIEDAVTYMRKVKGILPVTERQIEVVASDPNFASTVRAIHSYKYDYIVGFGDYDVMYDDGVIRKVKMSFTQSTDVNGNSYFFVGFRGDNPEIDDVKDANGYTTLPLKEKSVSFVIPLTNTDIGSLLSQLLSALKE